MKVLLIQDVYKLGRAGDVKKVADGYGRNFLIPQGLAVLATPGALKQVEYIRTKADANRAILNKEMQSVSDAIKDLTLTFPVKAGETGKLYGSITPAMISDAIKEATEVEINRRQIDSQPIRTLGVHKINIRLTIDLVPEITAIVFPEGETPESVIEGAEQTDEELEAVEAETEAVAVVEGELEADVQEEEVASETVEETETEE
jgi:large subunit ribosomal protein L9